MERIRAGFSFRKYAFDIAQWLHTSIKRVSVIVPNYNYARFLDDRLRSIVQQTYPVYELIVLDDASNDESVAQAREFLSGTEIDNRLIVNTTNSGSVFRQWRRGVEAATGDYIWIAEADDIAEPEFLAHAIAAFTDSEVVMSYTESQQMSADGTILCSNYLDYVADISPDRWKHAYRARGIDEIREALTVKNCIPNVSAVVFKRETLLDVLSTRSAQIESFRIAGDWVTYLNVLEHGCIAFVPTPLNRHRRHERSVTLEAFNVEQLKEIMTVQAMAASRVSPRSSVRRLALDYATRLYRQFGLATDSAPTPLEHDVLGAIARAIEIGRAHV